jgi:hypothetical protein
MPLQGGLTIERMCQLAQVSRAGFYRWLQEPQPVERDMEVRSAIRQIARIVPRPPCIGWICTFEPQACHIQPIDEGIDHTTNMVRWNQFLQGHRKQRPLGSPFSSNETHKKCLTHVRASSHCFCEPPSVS